MRRVSILIILSCILFGLIVWKPRSAGNISAGGADDLTALRSENTALKSELAVLRDSQTEAPSVPKDAIQAFVYSKYPFDIKSELLINMGASDGVRVGDGVFFGNIFFGKIEKIYDHSALVQTLFDERWQSPVRIGAKAFDALLLGGNEPKLSLIDKNANVTKGDPVYNAAAGFAYGVSMGSLGSASLTSDKLFQEGALILPYDVNNINVVLVVHAR